MEHIIVAVIILVMMLALIIYFWFLWGSKERAQRVEKRGMIPFTDDPVEERDNKNQ